MQDSFTYLHQLIDDAILDIRYAGMNNFVGTPIDGYDAPLALLTRPAAQSLADAAGHFRSKGYRLLLFDGYRPQRAVDHFVRWSLDPSDDKMKSLFYPTLEKSDLFPKGFIARKSGHSRGSTIDLSLAHMDGTPLDMGSPFDFFGPISCQDAQGLTPLQTQNRLLLREGIVLHGFRPYAQEWWHYTLASEPYPDTYFDFPIC